MLWRKADETLFFVDPGRDYKELRDVDLPKSNFGNSTSYMMSTCNALNPRDVVPLKKPPPASPRPPDPDPIPDKTAPKPGSVHTDRKIYRPKLPSRYIEPDLGPDLLDGMELIFKEFGKSLRKQVKQLSPRDDIVMFDPEVHQAEFDRNIRWRQCPQEHRSTITQIIKKWWDCFCEEGIRKHIRGFVCRVDTGDVPPVCCRVPRYGPHEAQVISRLVDHLESNGLIEDDDGPFGALVVLAAKPGQEDIPWHQYIWRLCVSYRRLNQVTRPFVYPIPRCDDAITNILPKFKVFLSFDMDCGYWQLAMEENSKAKTAFFTPNGKKRWTVMPMGFLNSHAIFVAMMAVLKDEWTKEARKQGLDTSQCGDALHGESNVPGNEDYGSQVIVDDVLLYATNTEILFKYFEIVLSVLQHHSATIKLKKCRFLESTLQFVGVDIGPDGNSPAASKFAAFRELPIPNTWTDLRMLIGMFGFYQQWLERYEVRIAPFRKLQEGSPRPGDLSFEEEASFFRGFWSSQHTALLEELKNEILSKPTLARPDPFRRFYLKTDWSKLALAAALCQGSNDPKSIKAEADEIDGGPCLYDKMRKGLRLVPVSFISRATSKSEQSFHSHVGEASAGRWAMAKYRKYLLGREFTWLSDSSGLTQFIEGEDNPTHVMQRWRAELLQFTFTFEHRPAQMMTEVDMLSRYNTATSTWRDELPENKPAVATTIPTNVRVLFGAPLLKENPRDAARYTLPPIELVGDPSWKTVSLLASKASRDRVIILSGSPGIPLSEAMDFVGFRDSIVIRIDDMSSPDIRSARSASSSREFFMNLQLMRNGSCECPVVDWFFAVYPGEGSLMGTTDEDILAWLASSVAQVETLIETCLLRAAVLCVPFQFPDSVKQFRKSREPPSGWIFHQLTLRNSGHGGRIETDHYVLVMLPQEVDKSFDLPEFTQPPGAMAEVLEISRDDALELHDFDIKKTDLLFRAANETTHTSRTARFLKNRTDPKPLLGWPTFDVDGPAPSIALPRSEEKFFKGLFAIWTERPVIHGDVENICRVAHTRDALRLLGCDESHTNIVLCMPLPERFRCVRTSVGMHGIAALLQSLYLAEQHEESSVQASYGPNVPSCPVLPHDNRSILPLPSEEQWKDATRQDLDLLAIINAAARGEIPRPHMLVDKSYLLPLQHRQIEVEDELVYFYEKSRAARVRQLRVRVVPISLRRVVIVACHSSPFAGHSGINRTLYRVQTRYWWPGVVRDVTEGVRGCGHCNLANAASHESQLLLHTLSCDTPFDVIFLDFWSPGDVPDKHGNVKVLTYMDCMTGFVMATFMSGNMDSMAVADAVVQAFFTSVGLPRLIFVDADSLFAGVFLRLFEHLGIPVEAIARENHKAMRNERFHRYLNKVERINSADKDTLFQWKQGALFSIYAWNAGPIDGTDLSRSLVVIGREFPFPIDLSPAIPRDAAGEGQQALDHFEAASPLLYKQRELLNVLNAERRLRHRELRNDGKNNLAFDIGDIVIVRKQVKSVASKNISAKLLFKTKGPYRVVCQLNPNSYLLQRLPFLRGLGRKGKLRKESAARMTKLPSTLVFHKKPDGADTRFALMEGEFRASPLAKWLGVLRCGAYQKAQDDQDWAFEPLESMWSDEPPVEVDDEDDSDYEPEESDDEVEDFHFVNEADQSQNDAADTDEPAVPQRPKALAPVPPVHDRTQKALRKLYRDIEDSTDRLFFVAFSTEYGDKPKLRLAQVVWNDCDPVQTQQAGIYRVRWWIVFRGERELATRALTDSRFQPDVRKIRADGSMPGQSFPLKAAKVDELLKEDPTLAWLADDIPLAEIRVVGPFDFTQKRMGLDSGPKKHARSETHHIDDVYWQALERDAHRFDLPVDFIRHRRQNPINYHPMSGR